MDWANEQDLVAGWLLRKPMPGDSSQRTALLLRAQRRIEREYRKAGYSSVEAAIAAGLSDADTIKSVQVELAMAVLRNPMGLSQMSETTGPFGASMTFAEGSRFGFTMTEDLYEDLGIEAFSTSRKTGTVPMWD